MSISAILWQFGFGAVCILLRFIEQPCWGCSRRCGRCWRRLCKCGCFSCGTGPPGCCSSMCQKLGWACSHMKPRWYWLLLANNVGFMIREFVVISMLDGWCLEVIVADVAIWLSLLMVSWEVWRFSTVRPRAPKTVDQVLDMLLLPLNYGMFCALCVRILKLQHSDENQEMVTAVIDSADIWESWALWSVLELFVLVVENGAKRDMRRTNDPEYLATIKAFKTLSLHGVKAFFLILVAFIGLDLSVKGIIAPSAPTICFWVYKECMSCHDWYSLHINPVAQSIIYIMCSFALIFVFTFERMFSEYLHCIQPYWKFWGVKLVVSVTYFQWLVISYCFGLSSREVYLWHCLLCCIEMPLLAILHATCAYPYGKPWLDLLLDHVPTEDEDLAEQPAVACASGVSLPPLGNSEAPPAAEAVGRDTDCEAAAHDADGSAGRPAVDGPIAPVSPGEDPEPGNEPSTGSGSTSVSPHWASQSSDVSESMREMAAAPLRWQQESTARPWCSLLLNCIVWIGLCYGAFRLIFAVVPPEYDVHPGAPIYNMTCNAQDLGKFVEQESKLHWLLPEDGPGQLQIPGTAGTWLPLCGSTVMDCGIGYQGNPTISCTAHGEYAWTGVCEDVVCGPPQALPHAEPKYDHRAWTSGMKVTYSCDKGYAGSPVAICGKDGNYTVTGECKEIVCPNPPAVPFASLPPGEHKWKEGMKVRYQCKAGYRGTPVGVCREDEVWKMEGQCLVMCPTPPVLPHAIPKFNRTSTQISIGTRLKYKCDPGYGGHPVATCDTNGSYLLEGACEKVCGSPLQVAHGNARIDVDPTRVWKVGAKITYWCDAGYGGDPVAQCGEDGQWSFPGKADKCVYSGCGSLDSFLTNNVSSTWQKTMAVLEKLNFTSSDYGDVVFFRCKEGFKGSPLATCLKGNWQLRSSCTVACGPPPQVAHSETVMRFNHTDSDHAVVYHCQPGYTGNPLATCDRGNWQLTAECAAYDTSLGCKCKTDWKLCEGSFGTNCRQWHGCTARAWGAPYGWCDVSSCPKSANNFVGSVPSWDYCAKGPENITWVPEHLADDGPPTPVRFALGIVLAIGGLGSGAYLYRKVQARRARLHEVLNDHNDAADALSYNDRESPQPFSSTSRDFSLPDLRTPEPPLDETSAEISSPELPEPRPA